MSISLRHAHPVEATSPPLLQTIGLLVPLERPRVVMATSTPSSERLPLGHPTAVSHQSQHEHPWGELSASGPLGPGTHGAMPTALSTTDGHYPRVRYAGTEAYLFDMRRLMMTTDAATAATTSSTLTTFWLPSQPGRLAIDSYLPPRDSRAVLIIRLAVQLGWARLLAPGNQLPKQSRHPSVLRAILAVSLTCNKR